MEDRKDSVDKIALTVAEAAKQLSVSRPTLLSWIHRNGGVPHFYAGKKILIPRRELVEWVAQQAREKSVL